MSAKSAKNTENTGPAIRVIDISDRSQWDKFVTGRTEANFLQSWDFYEFHRARGRKVVRRAAVDGSGKILGVYAGVVETARRGTYLAIAGGPLGGFDDWMGSFLQPGKDGKDERNRAVLRALFADIYEQGRQNHCVFVRVRPQWELSEKSLAILAKNGFRPAPMYLSVEFAGILDLRKTEAEILAGASQGLRRKLRKAAKEDIQISAEDTDAAIEAFCDLEQKHAARQQYVAFSGDFLRKQFEAFREHGEVLIYSARRPDGEILAQNFIIFYGKEASYHYGVSSEAGTRISAAPLLHIAAMAEARKRGCTRYNLWGIVGREETGHRFYGVSEFKRSFGCAEFHYTPAHDLVLEPVKYQMTKLIETARKHHRHV